MFGLIISYKIKMYIPDGLLALPVLAAGWAITVALVAVTLWWSERAGDVIAAIPRLAVMTSASFVLSLLHIPIGPTCVHLTLAGLMGIILGNLAFPAIFIWLTLQAFLLGHGGVTVLGVNTAILGIPALVAYGIFKSGAGEKPRSESGTETGGITPVSLSRSMKHKALLGALAGGIAVVLVVALTVGTLYTLGEGYIWAIKAVVVVNIPLVAIEAVITGSAVAFLLRVKPELLWGK